MQSQRHAASTVATPMKIGGGGKPTLTGQTIDTTDATGKIGRLGILDEATVLGKC